MIEEEIFKSLLNDHQMYHSDFQIDHFITTKAGGTLYGMYCQSLRELDTRYNALKDMMIDLKIERLRAKELENKSQGFPVSHIHDMNKLEALKKRMAIDGMERGLYHKMREFARFYYQAKSLKEKLGELGETKRARLEHEMWLHKLRIRAYVDIISKGHVSDGVIENIMSLNNNDCDEILRDIESPGNLVEYFKKNRVSLPEYKVDSIEFDIIKELVNVKP